MPQRSRQDSSSEGQLAELEAELAYFSGIISSYPTKIRSEGEAKLVRNRWDNAKRLADKLLWREPDSIEVKVAMGELLRMGHNIDVPGAARACDSILNEVVRADPENLAAHLFLGFFYTGVGLEPAAETHLLKAEGLASPKVIPDIYRCLGFACLGQDRVPEAIAYWERYLEFHSSPEIGCIVAELKAGRPVQFKVLEGPDLR